MSDNREFIEEFLVESSENLDQLDRDLIALEERPDDAQRVASIFRAVHTIKGNSGFFGFSKLGALAHSGEHLLGKLRDGKLTLDDRVAGSLYSMVDAVRSILRSIEETGGEGDHDYRELSRTLAAVAAEEAATPRPADPAPAPVSAAAAAVPAVPVSPAATVAVSAPAVTAPSATAPSTVEPPVAAAGPAAAESTVRVDVGLLASILDLVGELVLARNQLRSIDSEDPAVQAVSQRINAVTGALQEAAVKTRMQPIEHVFSKFPRTVRDLAVACGKEVQLVVDGADTELDRTLVESIRDPLTHLIRNAVDHGIEAPDVRAAQGKPRAGRLTLRAFNESGQVTIEVSDDGAGIAVEAVREKAVARGLIDTTAAATLSDDRILQFIFEPGFSTAKQVTSVSGRGVGMDVVKTNIEAIGGTVDIHSRAGAGTTVRVRVPLTLAIIPALIVRCGGERFALPQTAVSELVPLRPDRAGPRIEGLADAPVMRVRGRLVPVVFLDRFLGLRAETACRDQGTVVLVRVDDREFGLVVDGMQAGGTGSRDLLEAVSLSTVVVKPIGGLLAQLGLYSGATVLGDGGVVLILDLRGILKAAALPPIEREAAPVEPCLEATDRSDRYLVCTTRAGRRIALPLARVVRLEQYAAADLEPLGARLVIRRGDAFTPVVDADTFLGGRQAEPGERVQIVVLDDRRSGLGLAVGGILDVVTAESDLQPDLAAPGICGSLALGGLATEVLDLASTANLGQSA
jgi:two-component system chemotaxis sensor kinase CheA